jgi:hypothetical protein
MSTANSQCLSVRQRVGHNEHLIALGRRNYLLAGSNDGGRRAAIVYSLIESARMISLQSEASIRAGERGSWSSARAVCYNSMTGHGQMSWVVDRLRRKHEWKSFVLSMLSINRGILLDSVEMLEAGEQVDSKERQQNVRLAVSV